MLFKKKSKKRRRTCSEKILSFSSKKQNKNTCSKKTHLVQVLRGPRELEAPAVQDDDAVEAQFLGHETAVGGRVEPGRRVDGEHPVQGDVEGVDTLKNPAVQRHPRVVQVGVVGQVHRPVLRNRFVRLLNGAIGL